MNMSRRRSPDAAGEEDESDAATGMRAPVAKPSTRPAVTCSNELIGVIDWSQPGWKEIGRMVWHYWDGDHEWCAQAALPLENDP